MKTHRWSLFLAALMVAIVTVASAPAFAQGQGRSRATGPNRRAFHPSAPAPGTGSGGAAAPAPGATTPAPAPAPPVKGATPAQPASPTTGPCLPGCENFDACFADWQRRHPYKPRPKKVACGTEGSHTRTDAGQCVCDLRVHGIYEGDEQLTLNPSDVRMWYSVDPKESDTVIPHCDVEAVMLAMTVVGLDEEGKKLSARLDEAILTGGKALDDAIKDARIYSDAKYATKADLRTVAARVGTVEKKVGDLQGNSLHALLGGSLTAGSFNGLGQAYGAVDLTLALRIGALSPFGLLVNGAVGGGGSERFGELVRFQGGAAFTITPHPALTPFLGARLGQCSSSDGRKFGTNWVCGDVAGWAGLYAGSQNIAARADFFVGRASTLFAPGDIRSGLAIGGGLALVFRTGGFL